MGVMADDIKSSELPLAITHGLFIQPPAYALPLSINRRYGSLDSYTYVYAGKLPLRIENRITDRTPSDALPLTVNRLHSTILPARYVSSSALPLAITRPLTEQSPASALPLAIDREHGTLIKDRPPKPKSQAVAASSWLSSGIGVSSVRHLDRTLMPVGFDSLALGVSSVLADVAEGYFPSSELKLPIAVSTAIRPLSSELPLSIYREHGQWLNRPNVVPGNRKYIYPNTFIDGAVSLPILSLDKQYALPLGVDNAIFGVTVVRSDKEFLYQVGWQSSAASAGASVINRNQRITTQGFDVSVVSKPLIYNLTQYRTMRGFDASSYGSAYLQGGVKYLSPRGYDASVFGKTQAINTTADQTAKPTGINSLAISAPIVSPRILYPSGFYNNGVYTNGQYETIKFGTPDVRDPAIKPIGETHTKYGLPTVWFHTRPLSPNGILSYQSGYPRVADPTQFAYPPSLLTSAIFGDTAIRNLSFKVSVPAIFDGGFSDYTTLTNSNRYYKPSGINSLVIGAASITNKTPSIFVDGIKPYDVGTPAIGHAIRTVVPTGFDHLLFGRAVLTKTPEIFPRGHQSSAVGQAWISHKNRDIDLSQKGIDSFKAGNQTVWYGQRPFRPIGWQTADYGKPVLTHEVRELISQGFKRDAYGSHWISQGTRAIEPQGIYKDFPSNHMVGGTQTIKPAGYEATLWGERIIPISQSVQPLGFIGLWGNALVDLKIKYIAPVGYISVGQQPADRWGDIVVYNKLQYIVQEFDVNSGLVPPKWSDYLLVENRNKTIGATSFVATKFGYSQVDNNAAPLLPEGITPLPITIGMISHGIRAIAPEAIEPILMSEWAVVHNGARVIAPTGSTHTNYGQLVVANTSRYYSGIGRFESLETGTPMIAYAIRTVDIEPRYSIAPPQINLPTIDLYTRYVGFNGYETAKYGLPSLSIHFNIIGPKWNHRDDFGYGAVRNVTPELQVGAFDSQEFGNAGVRTQWRHVLAQGDTATLFGSARIADRKQSVTVPGWQDSASSQKHVVTKTGTPPYVTQNIWLQNESNPSNDGYGIGPTSDPSKPGLNQNVIYHRGHNSQRFGEAFVYSNNLYIEIGISTKNIAKGPTISNKIRMIDVSGINNKIYVSENLRVSPFYIKPKSFNQPKDGQTFGFNDDKFGSTRVTNQNRFIYPKNHSSSIVGSDGRVYLKDRYIEVPAIRGFAMGFPEIPFTLKTIDAKDYGFNSASHGATTVSRPPYTGPQTINAKGFNSLNINTQKIELFNRELQASGSNSLRMGASKSNDTPYMWQGLRIGEFVPMSIGAGDTSSFGEARIDLRVREIPVDGFVAFRSEYEPINFKDRMKVIGTITDNVKSQGIVVGGISSQAMGSAGVKLGQYFIRPDGNSDQFRKSSYSAEFGAPTISG